MTRKGSRIYQIKVTLEDVPPAIWRRVQVPGDITLFKLHETLQIVMGWDNYHLHSFLIHGEHYGDPTYDEFDELGTKDETRYKLSQVIREEGVRFVYEYDFGDGWEHTLLVEKILPAEKGIHYPRCVKGKRACPPEDVGGVWGYEEFLKAINDPEHSEYDEYRGWIGSEFDPEAFDLEEVNALLRSTTRDRNRETFSAWSIEDDRFRTTLVDTSSTWAQGLPEDQRAVAENLPLRRDTVTLLTYLRDNRVTGTQSKGNLALKAVHEISEHFVNPPVLEKKIGDSVFRIRSEEAVWPLYFVHVLASVSGLVTGGSSRRWWLTPLGEQFLTAPAPLQVWLLFTTWWTQTNWAMASPYEFRDDSVPASFREFTLDHLLDLPVESRMLFEPFADRLIEDIGLVWPIEDQDHARYFLRAIVEKIVVDPLTDFGILIPEHGPHKTLGARYKELLAFQVTPMGRGLLEAMKALQISASMQL